MPSTLISETASAQKLSHYGSWWYVIGLYGFEIRKKILQSACFGVCRRVLRNFNQEIFCQRLQYAYFIQQRGVEYAVCIFLIREDVLFFSVSDTFPTHYGILGRVSSVIVIPDYSSQKAVVAAAYEVVLIQSELRECRNEDIVFVFRRYLCTQCGVQGVYALDYDNGTLLHFQFIAALHSFSLYEIEAGQFYLLPVQELTHLMVEIIQVQGFETFEIIVSFRISRRMLPVDEVIVQRDLQRSETKHRKLCRNTTAGSRLSRR